MADSRNEIDEEFLPLPYYTWEIRPSTLPLDIEEAATALYLNGGVVSEAAARLKVPELKLQRLINRSPRLTRLHAELVALLNDKVLKQVITAFEDPENRRREWASAQVIRSDSFKSHPLAPSTNTTPAINLAGPQRIVISWQDTPSPPPPEAIEHNSDE